MISHEYRAAYIHIPKTGGLSIRTLLTNINFPQEQSVRSGHRTYSDYIDFYDDQDDYYIFTFVRNPWDRLVSAYHYFKKGGRGKHTSSLKGIFQNYSFKRFVIDRFFDSKDYEMAHFKSQMHWIQKPEKMSFIGRFENYQNDFNTVCDKIGIPRQQLPHVNKSKHKHYTKHYDDETREIVAERYAKDIEYFGYVFGE